MFPWKITSGTLSSRISLGEPARFCSVDLCRVTHWWTEFGSRSIILLDPYFSSPYPHNKLLEFAGESNRQSRIVSAPIALFGVLCIPYPPLSSIFFTYREPTNHVIHFQPTHSVREPRRCPFTIPCRANEFWLTRLRFSLTNSTLAQRNMSTERQAHRTIPSCRHGQCSDIQRPSLECSRLPDLQQHLDQTRRRSRRTRTHQDCRSPQRSDRTCTWKRAGGCQMPINLKLPNLTLHTPYHPFLTRAISHVDHLLTNPLFHVAFLTEPCPHSPSSSARFSPRRMHKHTVFRHRIPPPISPLSLNDVSNLPAALPSNLMSHAPTSALNGICHMHRFGVTKMEKCISSPYAASSLFSRFLRSSYRHMVGRYCLPSMVSSLARLLVSWYT